VKHSRQLLAETDRDFLLQEKFEHFVWYSIGAAQLDRKNASNILRDAEEQEKTKPLIAALIRDPRFNALEWNSLDDLVRIIARWTGQHSGASYPENQARSEDPAVRDKALAEYRRRIRGTIPLWLPRTSRASRP